MYLFLICKQLRRGDVSFQHRSLRDQWYPRRMETGHVKHEPASLHGAAQPSHPSCWDPAPISSLEHVPVSWLRRLFGNPKSHQHRRVCSAKLFSVLPVSSRRAFMHRPVSSTFQLVSDPRRKCVLSCLSFLISLCVINYLCNSIISVSEVFWHKSCVEDS